MLYILLCGHSNVFCFAYFAPRIKKKFCGSRRGSIKITGLGQKKKFGKRCSKGLNYQATDELLANEEEQDVTLVNEVTIENNNVSVLIRLNHFY
jgi:hypothetical protein